MGMKVHEAEVGHPARSTFLVIWLGRGAHFHSSVPFHQHWLSHLHTGVDELFADHDDGQLDGKFPQTAPW